MGTPSPANGASEAARRQKPLLLRLLAGFFARLAASSGTNCEMAEAAGRIEGMALDGEGSGSRRPPGPPAGPAPPASRGALSMASAPPQERRGPRLLSLGRVAPVAAARLAQDAIATTPPACPGVAPVAAAGGAAAALRLASHPPHCVRSAASRRGSVSTSGALPSWSAPGSAPSPAWLAPSAGLLGAAEPEGSSAAATAAVEGRALEGGGGGGIRTRSSAASSSAPPGGGGGGGTARRCAASIIAVASSTIAASLAVFVTSTRRTPHSSSPPTLAPAAPPPVSTPSAPGSGWQSMSNSSPCCRPLGICTICSPRCVITRTCCPPTASGGTVTRNFIVRSSGADAAAATLVGMGTSTWNTSPSLQPGGMSALKRCGGVCGVRNWTSSPGAMPGGTVTTIFCIRGAETLAGLSASNAPLGITPPPLRETLYLSFFASQPSTLAACPLICGFALRPTTTTEAPTANLKAAAAADATAFTLYLSLYASFSAAESAFHIWPNSFLSSRPSLVIFRSAGRSGRCSRQNSW
eukprot:scaffold77894_cov62-Phaeocystis_antarctica.AAC.2